MKKLIAIAFVLTTLIAVGSCSTDDNNDIEIIMPGDTVIMGKYPTKRLF